MKQSSYYRSNNGRCPACDCYLEPSDEACRNIQCMEYDTPKTGKVLRFIPMEKIPPRRY